MIRAGRAVERQAPPRPEPEGLGAGRPDEPRRWACARGTRGPAARCRPAAPGRTGSGRSTLATSGAAPRGDLAASSPPAARPNGMIQASRRPPRAAALGRRPGRGSSLDAIAVLVRCSAVARPDADGDQQRDCGRTPCHDARGSSDPGRSSEIDDGRSHSQDEGIARAGGDIDRSIARDGQLGRRSRPPAASRRGIPSPARSARVRLEPASDSPEPYQPARDEDQRRSLGRRVPSGTAGRSSPGPDADLDRIPRRTEPDGITASDDGQSTPSEPSIVAE